MICDVDQEHELAQVGVGWSGMLEIGWGEAHMVRLDWMWSV